MYPELLSPVGNREMAEAAVHNGADAIYVGVPGFNARGRTADFSLEDLAELVRFCRLRGVRVFYALNVLVFERELRGMVDWLRGLVDTRPDAFIVQDLGLARLLHQIAPGVRLHASTQATIASAEAIRELQDLGFCRFVLARELPLEGIRTLRSRVPDAEIEVFVHGALCVAYSGQCLTSESFGGRSANRGQCAQSCRLPYELIVDGARRDTQGRDYLFSPRDLCALEQVKELAEIGVHSLKIEGRLKTPEYVAATTEAYYKAIHDLPHNDTRTLEAVYSRGFFSGWLLGSDHRHLVDGTYSSHQGERIGTVVRNARTYLLIQTTTELFAGDGLLLESHHGSQLGGRIFSCQAAADGCLRLEFGNHLDLSAVSPGWTVWRNDCPTIEKSLRRSWQNKSLQRRVEVSVLVSGFSGAPLQIQYCDASGLCAKAQSRQVLESAKRPATPQEQFRMQEEATALSGSAYQARHVQWDVDPQAFVPTRILRDLRKQACAALDELRLQSHPSVNVLSNGIPEFPEPRPLPQALPRLHLLVRSEQQLACIADLPIDTVYLDFEYGRGYRQAMDLVRAAGYRAGLTTLRVHRQGEDRHVQSLSDLAPDCILVRNPGALHLLRDKGIPLRGDFSLNVVNSLSAQIFRDRGLETIHPGFDCNREQLVDLLAATGGQGWEISLHHYMPAFHMEHCVFAAFLSNGKDFRDCGMPCARHKVEVRDHRGAVHVLQSDAECRNTLFLSAPQSPLRFYPELRQLGVSQFRLEVLQEDALTVANKVRILGSVLAGTSESASALTALGAEGRFGITEGQVFHTSAWKDRKKSHK